MSPVVLFVAALAKNMKYRYLVQTAYSHKIKLTIHYNPITNTKEILVYSFFINVKCLIGNIYFRYVTEQN